MTEDKATRAKAKPHGLGRGLSALLGAEAEDYASLDKVRDTKAVPIELLRPSRYQPRQVFDTERLDELVESIREKGILQPILVRRLTEDPGQYEIIAGERRWRAAQKAKLHKVPVVVKEFSDAEALEVAIIENVQRADLSPIEEARGYSRLIEEFGHTQEQVGQLVGKSRSHVANMLRLLGLPEAVQDMLASGQLTMGHARTLINAEDPLALAKKIVEDNLNVRAAEDLARSGRAKRTRPRAASPTQAKDPDTLALEKDLSQTIGLKVTLNDQGGGKGSLRIEYQTLEQLDEICRRLCQN
ncbi:MAG: ParB/RepB/Spo0J family partition protein [Alphaproteobacteria bacterium]|nr:MAG: ParB/RepB/Spo0J family partition protein [Alphaproteobacteria bacterium]